jgi:hypothetical protein
MVYDGLASTCADLAAITPNCTSLNDALKLMADKICEALANNGLDGAGYDAASVTSLTLDGLLTSRSIVITPIEVPGFTGTSYDVGCRVRLASLANPTIDYMEGVVTAFNNNTGAMTFLADHFGATASGTHIDWEVSLAGDVGATGATGPTGAGGTVFEQWIKLNPAFTWVTGVSTLVPGATHTVGADGNYQVFLSTNTEVFAGSGFGDVQLYVNGVNVAEMATIGGSEVIPDTAMKHQSLNWRGALLEGQAIEFKVLSISGPLPVTYDTTMLINKES